DDEPTPLPPHRGARRRRRAGRVPRRRQRRRRYRRRSCFRVGRVRRRGGRRGRLRARRPSAAPQRGASALHRPRADRPRHRRELPADRRDRLPHGGDVGGLLREAEAGRRARPPRRARPHVAGGPLPRRRDPRRHGRRRARRADDRAALRRPPEPVGRGARLARRVQAGGRALQRVGAAAQGRGAHAHLPQPRVRVRDARRRLAGVRHPAPRDRPRARGLRARPLLDQQGGARPGCVFPPLSGPVPPVPPQGQHGRAGEGVRACGGRRDGLPDDPVPRGAGRDAPRVRGARQARRPDREHPHQLREPLAAAAARL
ncbi:MAG: Sugar phosphate isomerases/epimerases, partial [uncultured Gemmatimonadaceae bacterium]